MNYEEFLKKLAAVDGVYIHQPIPEKKDDTYNWRYQDRHEWRTQHTIEQDWLSGGIDGGNCWSDGGHFDVRGDPTPTHWAEFDNVIMALWPDISFIQYRKFIQPLVETHESTQTEYYGNYSIYTHNVVNLQKLFTVLRENGKL